MAKKSRRSVLSKKRRRRARLLNSSHGIFALGLFLIFALAFSLFLGDAVKITGDGGVYAAEENIDSSENLIPFSLLGVAGSLESETEQKDNISRIGSSAENMMVGQVVSAVTEEAQSIDISSSLENTIAAFSNDALASSGTPTIMSDDDYENLLRIVQAEAGDEDLKGQILVANVIMNRVKYHEFPDNISDVIFEHRDGIPQFAPIYDGAFYTVTVSDSVREAVKQCMDGVDYSEGALFFVQKDATSPESVSWFDTELKHLFKYGVHDFYTYPEGTVSPSASEDAGSLDSASPQPAES